jgi:hypothetical protein
LRRKIELVQVKKAGSGDIGPVARVGKIRHEVLIVWVGVSRVLARPVYPSENRICSAEHGVGTLPAGCP